jgi:hypothetical protein
MSRLARAYGVRRDHFDLRAAVGRRLSIPSDNRSLLPVGQAIVNVIRLPEGLDRILAGADLSLEDRRFLGTGWGLDQALLDAILADIRSTVSAAENR